jgi:hypothetical protein
LRYRPFACYTTLSSCLIYNIVLFYYCIASAYKTHLNRLFLYQKRAVRIISHSPPLAHSRPLFNQMKILHILEIFSYQVSCFIFQHNNNLLPQPIASLFTVNSEMHHHNTRQKHNLHFTFNKLSFSIRSQGPKIWNSIPYTIRNSLKSFNYKRILKDYYLSQAY